MKLEFYEKHGVIVENPSVKIGTYLSRLWTDESQGEKIEVLKQFQGILNYPEWNQWKFITPSLGKVLEARKINDMIWYKIQGIFNGVISCVNQARLTNVGGWGKCKRTNRAKYPPRYKLFSSDFFLQNENNILNMMNPPMFDSKNSDNPQKISIKTLYARFCRYAYYGHLQRISFGHYLR